MLVTLGYVLSPFSLTSLSISQVVLVISFFLLGVFIIKPAISQWSRLRHVPGPFLNSITPLVYAWHTIRDGQAKYVYSLCQKYGPVVRVTPNTVVVSDPQTLRYFCSLKANYTKGLWAEFTRWDLKRYSCIAMRDNESRRERKKKLLPAWSGQGLNVMEDRVDARIRDFLDLVERKYISTPAVFRPMEFGHRAQFFTLDVVTAVTFGKPWGFLEKDGDVNKYLEITEVMTPMFALLGALPWLVHSMHTWPLTKLMPGAGDQVGFGCLIKLASDEVQKRLQPDDKSSEFDLINAYLKQGIDPEDVVQECITLAVAGSETTSAALRVTLLALLTTPEAYRKLQAEVDAFFANSSKSPNDVISYADVKELKYLQAVIRESLRVWPNASGISFTKQVPDTGDTIYGYRLPKGTEISGCLMAMTRNKSLFGADADIFRPERWLEADPTRAEEMWATVELNFSAGKYVCLGKQLALMELGKWFPEILRRYEIAPTNNPVPMKLIDSVTWLPLNFWVRFTKRETTTEAVSG
ncbi:cytochrome P450 [Podospora australis]|uniref:Cytochrome P450 n=1 Tax=Podospora australis TaxID=1536484 RepID=A0AAN6WKT5_9PEZI|nr:cytochrome P450 [Podospora australis]